MDRRKKRTSTNQYQMYIELMEKDAIFATGRVPRDADVNYLQKKWKELSDKLNSCGSGPTLTAEEWRKRLNDWKNTTRCKYRRSISGEKDIAMTTLEMKALDLFGKAPNVSVPSEQLSIHLKSEKPDNDDEVEQQRTSESFQKELQAAVEEAIGGGDEEEDGLAEENDEQEEVLSDPIATSTHAATSEVGGACGGSTTTYRTIVVENAQFADEDNNEETLEFITHRRQTLGPSSSSSSGGTVATGLQTVVTTTTPTATVTKLINGEMPLKRLRTQAPEQIIYEVKKSVPQHHSHHRNITIHNSAGAVTNPLQHHHHLQQHLTSEASIAFSGVTSQDARELSRQLKRLADIKSEKLKFEIARFKFNNPGFCHNYPS